MATVEIKYQDKLTILLDDDCEPTQIICDLPVLGEGNSRIVYDLGDKILKVAKSAIGSMCNHNENDLWQFLGERSEKLKINEIFEIDENGYWYVAEKIQIGGNAINEALKYIQWLDYSDNAGYDKNGKLTIVDAEEVRVADLEYLLRKGVI